MDLKSKVTIGIPVYNEARYIREALDSAIIQGAVVIVSDNASTDETRNICKEYENKGLITYYRHAENQGATKNSIFLAEMATTPYFMYLGGHDILADGYVATLFTILEDHPDYSLCSSNRYTEIDAQGREIGVSKNFRKKLGWNFGRNLLGYDSPVLRTSFYIIHDRFNVLAYGLFRLPKLMDYWALINKNAILMSYGSDCVMMTRMLAMGKAYCANYIAPGYYVRLHRNDEALGFWGNVKRQYNAVSDKNKAESIDRFFELYILNHIAIADIISTGLLNKFIKSRWEIILKKKLLRWFIALSIGDFVDGKMDIPGLEKVKIEAEQKIKLSISSSFFWDIVSVRCLGAETVLFGSRKISNNEYAEIRKRFTDNGLKIPLWRRFKWFLKYALYERCKRFF
jgi:glycosyltransferase involved in cell wall biosynthesis